MVLVPANMTRFGFSPW